jgi:hypothetical protein
MTQEILPEKQELEGLLCRQVLQYLRINLLLEYFSMLYHSLPLRALAAGFAAILVLSYASTDMAQSGRRVRKSAPAPISAPEPTATPTANASAEKPKPRFTFLAGLDRYDGLSNIPLWAYEGVLRSLTGRLDDAPSVHIGGAQSEMSRSNAIQKAKVEKEAYVIWLQVRADNMNPNTRNSGSLDKIIIEYWVFAPTTAKVTTSGRTYTETQRNKVILSPRSIYGDRYMILAAQEAADRILAHFHVQTPPIKLP